MTARHLALVGPTATGKTSLAVALARAVDGVELVSVDAMAVYRRMDIGTAKPTAEERRGLRWHLVDLVEPSEEFSVSRFQAEAGAALAAIEARGNVAVLVGGTGLYHAAVVDGLRIPARYPEVAGRLAGELAGGTPLSELYERLSRLDPLAASRIEPGNERRILRALEVTIGSGHPFSASGPGLQSYGPSRFALLGLDLPPPELGARIERRLDDQLRRGFVEEVRRLLDGPDPLSHTAAQALGYRELSAHLRGGCTLDEARAETVRRTRGFARRQRAWFRRDPRVRWWRADAPGLLEEMVAQVEALRAARGA